MNVRISTLGWPFSSLAMALSAQRLSPCPIHSGDATAQGEVNVVVLKFQFNLSLGPLRIPSSKG